MLSPHKKESAMTELLEAQLTIELLTAKDRYYLSPSTEEGKEKYRDIRERLITLLSR